MDAGRISSRLLIPSAINPACQAAIRPLGTARVPKVEDQVDNSLACDRQSQLQKSSASRLQIAAAECFTRSAMPMTWIPSRLRWIPKVLSVRYMYPRSLSYLEAHQK
jgi:hypothetical protein